MNKYNDLSTLKQRYSSMASDDLIRIVTKDIHEYTPEALEIVRKELASRDVTNYENPLEDDKTFVDKKEIKPATKVMLRIFSYIIWPIAWMFLIGILYDIFIKLTAELLNGMVVSDIDQSSITANIKFLYLLLKALIFILFWVVILKGFLIIKKRYQNKIKIIWYIIWPITWIFSVGFIAKTFENLSGLLFFEMINSGVDSATTNVRILCFIGGAVGAALFCIPYYILIKGFFFITKVTKANK